MRRIEQGVGRLEPLSIEVDGEAVDAYPGETVATALLASGRRALRTTQSGRPRGPFCNMGVCFECVVTVDGVEGLRACQVRVADGMRVTSERRGPA